MNKASIIASAVSGFLFAVGLGLGGMTDANVVLAFLDLAGDWDPRLAVVMASALLVYAPAHQFAIRRAKPLVDDECCLPTRRDLDGALVLGAAVFGVGWGMAGFCPGPAIVSSATLSLEASSVVATMALGMWAGAWVQARRRRCDPASVR